VTHNQRAGDDGSAEAPFAAAEVTRHTVLPDVVGDQKRARFVDRNADRPAERLSVVVYEAGENIDRLSRRAAIFERHEDNL